MHPFFEFWFGRVQPVFKYAIALLILGIGLILQPTIGLAWFMQTQLPFGVSPAFFGFVAIFASAMIVVSELYADGDLRYRMQLLASQVLLVYVLIALYAGFRPFEGAPPELRPNGSLYQFPYAALAIYGLCADRVIGDIVRRHFTRLS